mmetsp:Transcript_105874/g.265101  ORF Transcript_105874/g.265101 Transcript_105874/m.265101 type:complete len:427 (-) Transcript_105874:351-1631(-)
MHRLALDGVEILRVLRHRRRVLLVRRLQVCQLRGVLRGGVAEEALEVLEALLHSQVVVGELLLVLAQPVVRLAEVVHGATLLLTGRDARVHAVELRLGAAELLDVPVGAVSHELLEVVHPLAHRGVLRVGALQRVEVLRLLRQPRNMLVVRGLQRLQSIVMIAVSSLQAIDPVFGRRDSSHQALLLARQRRHALPVRRALRLAGREARVQLVVGGLEGGELLPMVLGRVPQHPLQPREPILHRRLPRALRALHELDVLGGARERGEVLVVGGLQSQQLGRVLVRRVAEGLLQVVHPLLQARVVLLLHGAILLEIAQNVALPLASGHAPVHVLELGVRRGEFCRVLVRGVANQLLQVLHPLLHAGVVRELRPMLQHLRVQQVEFLVRGLEVGSVPVRRVSEDLFQEVHSLHHAGVVEALLLHGAKSL